MSHTFRPRRRCVRQPWPAGEDLPAESLFAEAQRRRFPCPWRPDFSRPAPKMISLFFFLPLWCHLWIPSFVLICFGVFFCYHQNSLMLHHQTPCFGSRIPWLNWWCIPRRAHRASLTLGLLERSCASRRLHSCPQTAERRDVKSFKTEHTYFWSVGGYFWNK